LKHSQFVVAAGALRIATHHAESVGIRTWSQVENAVRTESLLSRTDGGYFVLKRRGECNRNTHASPENPKREKVAGHQPKSIFVNFAGREMGVER
jgi:hypothetical protein